MASNTYDMAFLHERATDAHRPLPTGEQAIVARANAALRRADAVIVALGGKAGRLGECVVGTGLLEGLLQAIKYVGKAGIPVTMLVDEAALALFDARLYQAAYWPQITIVPASQPVMQSPLEDAEMPNGQHVLFVDFHGAHDGLPHLQIEEGSPCAREENVRSITTLAHLFRVGVRSYAQRGPLRRYADFVEDLFALPRDTLDGLQPQPRLLLGPEDDAGYPSLAQECGLNTDAIQVVCFFQSVVFAKCYELWDEVMLLFCQYIAQHFPQRTINFLIACGPDEQLPEGWKKADVEMCFQDFTGINDNARVLVCSTPSLRHLAILASHACFALSNDTGPSHIAGALCIPTIIAYLPGTIYAKHIWSSTLWHHGIIVDPNPYSYQQLEAAVLWDHTDIINSIAPAQLYNELFKHLPRVLCRA